MLKRPSYLGSARGETRNEPGPGGAWLGGVRLGVTQAQPPCPAPSHGTPEGRRYDEARH